MPSETDLSIKMVQGNRWEASRITVLLCGAFIFALTSFFIYTRKYVNFGVESDLFLRFISEAELLKQGKALAVEYHLPFYSALLVIAEHFTGTWFEAGLIITWISTLAALVTSYRFARDLLDWRAALGVLIVCGASVQFLTHSSGASTDMLFLALYQGTWLAGLAAFRTRKRLYWLITGILIAVCYLTRSNGIIMLAFIGVPFLLSEELRVKIDAALVLLCGILIGFAPWMIYAVVTGSPAVPTHSYLTLATAFYDKDIGLLDSNDFIIFTETTFNNIWDVLAYNPARIPVAYAENVGEFIVVALPALVSIPLLTLLIPGILCVVLGSNSRFISFLALLTICHFLLVCLADFSPRYFLFLLPFLGLGLSTTIKISADSLQRISARRIFYGIVGLCVAISLILSVKLAWKDSRIGEDEVAAITSVLTNIDARDVPLVVAFKPQLVYHAKANWAPMPIVETLDELKQQLSNYDSINPLYLYFGSREAKYRPELAELRYGGSQIPWLVPVASGNAGGGWALYLVRKVSP